MLSRKKISKKLKFSDSQDVFLSGFYCWKLTVQEFFFFDFHRVFRTGRSKLTKNIQKKIQRIGKNWNESYFYEELQKKILWMEIAERNCSHFWWVFGIVILKLNISRKKRKKNFFPVTIISENSSSTLSLIVLSVLVLSMVSQRRTVKSCYAFWKKVTLAT